MSDSPASSARPSVAFFVLWEFHRPILSPVYDALRDEYPCLISNDPEEVVAFRPAVLVLADAAYDRFRARLPDTILVFTRHGFSSKQLWRTAFAGCDFACVSSPWVRRDLLKRGHRPRMDFWSIGFLPMDAVFQARRGQPPTNLRIDISPGTRTLLYAPTHNPGLHSFPVIGTDWIRELQAAIPALNIVIKPHPVTAERNPGWMAAWRQAAGESRRVLLMEDTHSDIYRFFPVTDVLLTDVSSVAFYFLAMDRPIVMVNVPHPEAAGDDYDPDGPEWQWRDMATTISHASEVVPVVKRCLDCPGENAQPRALYRERVFGGLTDGQACRRLTDRIRALLLPEGDRPEWAELAWNIARLRARNASLSRELQESRTQAEILTGDHEILRRELQESRTQAEALMTNLGKNGYLARELLRRSPGILKRRTAMLWNLLCRVRSGQPSGQEDRRPPRP